MTDFDEAAWRKCCEEAAADAMRGTGLVYELYQQKLNGLIRARVTGIDPSLQAQALKLASEEFGYSEFDEEPGDGYCMHFLEPQCCPVGCGDLEEHE